MCDACGLPENDVQRNFALIYYTATNWRSGGTSGTRSEYSLVGKSSVSVCNACIEKRYVDDWRSVLLWRRIAVGLILLWLAALILVLTVLTGNGEPTIVHYFVMPGGLIILLIGIFSFGSSRQLTRKNTTDRTLEFAARKVVPKRVAQLDPLDPIHYLVWTEEEWEKRLRESQRKK